VPLGGQPDVLAFMLSSVPLAGRPPASAPVAASSTPLPSLAGLIAAPAPPVADPTDSFSLSTTTPSASTPAASRLRGELPPTTPITAAIALSRPTTPPALRRAGGRRGGPHRPRVTAAPSNPAIYRATPAAASVALAPVVALGAAASAGGATDGVRDGVILAATGAVVHPGASAAAAGIGAAGLQAGAAERAAADAAAAASVVPATTPATPLSTAGRRRSRLSGTSVVRIAAAVARTGAPSSGPLGASLGPTTVGRSLDSSAWPSQAAALTAAPPAPARARFHGGANMEVVGGPSAAGSAPPGPPASLEVEVSVLGTTGTNDVGVGTAPVGAAVQAAEIAVADATAAAETGNASGLTTAQMTQAEATTLASLIKAATKLVKALSSEVKTMNQKVQTQGSCIERLGVALNEFKKRPRPVRRFVPPDVEDYCDYDELLSMFGYGGPVLSDSTEYVAKAGVKLSDMKKGALMMLNVRARVKARSFAEVATATTTKAVIQHPDDDFEMIIEETMDEHKMDENAARVYLRSWISGPETRPKTPKQLAAEKKSAEAYKSKHGKDKPMPSTPEKRRAYQPVTQSISHMNEAIKRPVVAAWFNAIEQTEASMVPADAAQWLTDVNPRKAPDEPAQARFLASARGRPAMTVAMHAMYIHLGAAGRIRAPQRCGDAEAAFATVGHYAVAVTFVRNALVQVFSGQRRRSGVDNGLYDLWRAELVGLQPLLPNNTTPWHGLVFTDGADPARFTFDVAHAPITG